MAKEKGLMHLFIIGVGLSIIPYPHINEGINNIFGIVRYFALWLEDM